MIHDRDRSSVIESRLGTIGADVDQGTVACGDLVIFLVHCTDLFCGGIRCSKRCLDSNEASAQTGDIR